MRTLGIVAHSYEGGTLCFHEACREGGSLLGEHMHPSVVVSAIPMGLSMPGWEDDDHALVAKHLGKGIQQVAGAGADFYICPDNTAHIVLEKIAGQQPIPGLHIADVVCEQIQTHGWTSAGLLGTKWTMTGAVYERALKQRSIKRLIPGGDTREQLNSAIFDELCKGEFKESTTHRFIDTIEDLKSRGAECVILGCTEIPLIINEGNSPLPILDSTRLLARAGVAQAISEEPLAPNGGWLPVGT